MRLLLVVEQSFAITGRGVVVMPALPVDEARRERFTIELRRPDGTCRTAEAFSQVPFVNPPPPVPAAHLTLLGITSGDVPAGTEVWTALACD